MVLRGYIYDNDGMTISMKGMHTDVSILNMHTDNIANFGIPGYQRRKPVITTFAEYLGPDGVDPVVDTTIGRLRRSGRPLDVALSTKGYFQRLMPDGHIELTRDGRFELDKNGALRSLDGKPILSSSGTPVQFTVMPTNLEKEVKISPNGEIQVFIQQTGKMTSMGKLGIANEQGTPTSDVNVAQYYVEDANVMLQDEYAAMMPLRREFESNRQLFIMQNDNLSRAIQELGRTQ